MELSEYRNRWKSKPVLRAVYNHYYEIILKSCTKGSILEIGGGTGNLKETNPNVVSVDIQPAPWLDAVADAQSLPYNDHTFNNIVMIDVLHHIENPTRFFDEASRVLTDFGRLVLLEPSITPISKIAYKLFHEEPVDMCQDPYHDIPTDPHRSPFDANQAIPTLIFIKTPEIFAERFPKLKVIQVTYQSLFAYPLSGGFKSWNLLPKFLIQPLLRVEEMLIPFIGKWLAFRMLVVIEKQI